MFTDERKAGTLDTSIQARLGIHTCMFVPAIREVPMFPPSFMKKGWQASVSPAVWQCIQAIKQSKMLN